MSLDIGTAFEEGVDRLATKWGGVTVGLLFTVLLVNTIPWQSLGRAAVRTAERTIRARYGRIPADAEPYYDQVMMVLGDAFPLAVDLPLPAIVGALVVLAFVAEAVHVVVVRVFASPRPGALPADLRRRLVGASVNGFLAGVLSWFLVLVGFVILVVPGIFLAIGFFFVRQEVAVGDENFLGALSASWEHTKGNRLQVFALGTVLFLVVVVAGQVGGFLGGTAGTVLGLLLGAVVGTFVTAVTTRAYQQVRGDGEGVGAEPSTAGSGEALA